MKIFIAAMGPGEIGQGIAFAQYALKKGADVTFAIMDKKNSPMVNLSAARFNVLLLKKNSKSLNNAVFGSKPDVLLLCNSKIFSADGFYPNHPPLPKPLTISIDSNWLFGPDSPYKSLPWVDKYCVNIPEKVFKLGLKKYGGHYTIPVKALKKIKIVGLLPSYSKIPTFSIGKIRNKYGVLRNEKLVFLYASTASHSASVLSQFLKKAIDVIRILRKKGHEIKIINVSEIPKNIFKIKEKWILNLNHVDAREFYKILASSDLVFQHQGLGTLAQAIGANIPVISNVRDLKDEESPYHTHTWEIMPFAKSGACSVFHFSAPVSMLATEMEKLLYSDKSISKMKKKQALLYESGEKNVFEEMKYLLKCVKENNKASK